MEDERRFTFELSVDDTVNNCFTAIKKEIDEDYMSAESELQVYLYIFEDFLRACTFVLDNSHLELVKDDS